MNKTLPDNNPDGGLRSPPANDNIFENFFEKMFVEPVKSAPIPVPKSNVYHDLAKFATKKRRFLQEESQK